jgi:hypothetical protein
MDVRETGIEDVNWMKMAQDRDHCQLFILAVLNFLVQ